MPKTVMFDATIHLGQFCLSSPAVRFGCKLSQRSIDPKLDSINIGLWTDCENGRVDNAVWSLPRLVQDEFYPFMDRFFSLKHIRQVQLEQKDVELALAFMKEKTGLAFQSAYACAVAINHKVDEVHTLRMALLNPTVVAHMKLNHGILITCPEQESEGAYVEEELEETYVRAMKAFQHSRFEVIELIPDSVINK